MHALLLAISVTLKPNIISLGETKLNSKMLPYFLFKSSKLSTNYADKY